MTIDRLFRSRHECDNPTRILTVGGDAPAPHFSRQALREHLQGAFGGRVSDETGGHHALATATSICRRIFTICSGVYFLALAIPCSVYTQFVSLPLVQNLPGTPFWLSI